MPKKNRRKAHSIKTISARCVNMPTNPYIDYKAWFTCVQTWATSFKLAYYYTTQTAEPKNLPRLQVHDLIMCGSTVLFALVELGCFEA